MENQEAGCQGVHFLFEPGEWLGYGEVVVSASPEKLRFHVEWKIGAQEASGIKAAQHVDIVGNEPMTNLFKIAFPEKGRFSIHLVNEAIGSFAGSGIVDSTCVAWEFRPSQDQGAEGALEGYEVYERLSRDEYTFKAEYVGSQERTTITGRLWRREKRA